MFVSTHVVSGGHSNGVFQLRAESSRFLLSGVLCEKQVGGNDGSGNDTGNNNGGGNRFLLPGKCILCEKQVGG